MVPVASLQVARSIGSNMLGLVQGIALGQDLQPAGNYGIDHFVSFVYKQFIRFIRFRVDLIRAVANNDAATCLYLKKWQLVRNGCACSTKFRNAEMYGVVVRRSVLSNCAAHCA